MKANLLFWGFSFLFSISISANNLANLIYLGMDCGSGGEVIFELNGDPNLFNYYWGHGPTDLHLTGLEPGIYTFYVRDFNGCEEEYEVEIEDFSNCQVEVDWILGEPCTAIIEVSVVDAVSGVELNSDFLTINWDDDPEAGATRLVPQYQSTSTTYNYEVYSNGLNNEICCYTSGSVTITPNPYPWTECEEEPESPIDSLCPRLIINEVSGVKNEFNKVQYVELLVVCEGNCGNKVDIGGFIVDDNNGSLVKGGNLIVQANSNAIGVDQGFIMFKNIENWQKVPNGSLIVIYEEGSSTGEFFPSDDPTDANEDGVYVLAANNIDYLFGRTGSWNMQTNEMEYSGNFIAPTWDFIQVSDHADAMQSRNESGHLSHGISMGRSMYATEEEFEMHLHEESPINSKCYLDQVDYNNKDHYSCESVLNTIGTPGLPNTASNYIRINQYRNCENQPCNPCFQSPGPNSENNNNANSLSVFPNPFNSNFQIDFFSHQQGISTIELFDASSTSLVRQNLETNIGKNSYENTSMGSLPSGVYFLRFKFPNGETTQRRLIRIQD